MWGAWVELYPTQIDLFWSQTMRTYTILMEAGARRLAASNDHIITAGWMAGVLSQSTEPPKLETLLVLPEVIEKQRKHEVVDPETEQARIEWEQLEMISYIKAVGSCLPKRGSTAATVQDGQQGDHH